MAWKKKNVVLKFISIRDAEAYVKYVRYCDTIGSAPLSLPDWIEATKAQVFAAFEKWVWHSTRDVNKPLPGEVQPVRGQSRHDQLALSDMVQQFGVGGFVIGELRRYGGVHPVRHQTPSNSERDNPSLTARTCHHCKLYKPASQFSKQEKSIRAVCKKCDSKARVARRRK